MAEGQRSDQGEPRPVQGGGLDEGETHDVKSQVKISFSLLGNEKKKKKKKERFTVQGTIQSEANNCMINKAFAATRHTVFKNVCACLANKFQ